MRLRTNIGWMLVGNSIFAACQWLYLITLSKISGTQSAGEYALCLAFIYPIFAISNMQLRRLQATDQEKKIPFYSYLIFSMLGGTVATIVCYSLFVSFEDRPKELIFTFLVLASAKYIETLSDACYGNMQQRENMRSIAISLIIRNVLALPIFICLIYYGYDVWKACLVIPLTWLFVFTIIDFRNVKPMLNEIPAISRIAENLRTIVIVGLPLTLVIFVNQLYLSTPRITLEHYFGINMLGLFAPIASLITLGSIVANSIGSASLPRLSKHYHTGAIKDYFRLGLRLIALTAAVGGGGIVIALCFPSLINRVLFNSHSAQADSLLCLVMIAGCFWYLSAATGTLLTAARFFRAQLYISLAMLAGAAIMSLQFVPSHGVIGAAGALIVGAAIKFALQFLIFLKLSMHQ